MLNVVMLFVAHAQYHNLVLYYEFLYCCVLQLIPSYSMSLSSLSLCWVSWGLFIKQNKHNGCKNALLYCIDELDIQISLSLDYQMQGQGAKVTTLKWPIQRTKCLNHKDKGLKCMTLNFLTTLIHPFLLNQKNLCFIILFLYVIVLALIWQL